ncbi:hypothetical protein HMPREF0239_05125 [Clostridium sp. ATCC BAA-442]|jgi:hypothetical protein|nr:hypothetical protein HMPREF0239_05125 [Clostridium sp. ATCC BAA-442]
MVQDVKKRFCPIAGTKAFQHFCDTTQIDVNDVHSLHAPSCVPDG